MVIDVVVGLLVVGFAAWSYFCGLLRKLAGIAALVVATLAASLVGGLVARWAATRWGIQTMNVLYIVCTVAAWVLLFVVGLLVLGRVARWVGSDAEGKPALWNKLLGGVLGLAQALIVCWFILAIFDTVPEDVRASRLRPFHQEMEASWFCLAVHATNPAARLELQPLVDDVSAIAARPAVLKNLQDEEVTKQICQTEKVREILADPKLLEEFSAGRFRRFFSDRRVRDALEDPEIRKLLRQTDVRDTLRRLAAQARTAGGE